LNIIDVIPKSSWSWDFSVSQDTEQIANILVSRYPEKGLLKTYETELEAYREDVEGDRFVLKTSKYVIGFAEKPSSLRRLFDVHFSDKHYTLKPASLFSKKFILMEGSNQIGLVIPRGFFSRGAKVELPENLPLSLKVFVIWLVLLNWRRGPKGG